MIMTGSEDGKVFMWKRTTDYVPQFNPKYTLRKKNRNTSYETFEPFSHVVTPCAIWVPFNLMKKFRDKMINHMDQIYVDSLMVLISFESDIKIVGNVIELS